MARSKISRKNRNVKKTFKRYNKKGGSVRVLYPTINDIFQKISSKHKNITETNIFLSKLIEEKRLGFYYDISSYKSKEKREELYTEIENKLGLDWGDSEDCENYKYILLKLKNDESIGVRRFGLKGFMCNGTYTNTVQITESTIYSFLRNHGDKKLLNFGSNFLRNTNSRRGIKKKPSILSKSPRKSSKSPRKSSKSPRIPGQVYYNSKISSTPSTISPKTMPKYSSVRKYEPVYASIIGNNSIIRKKQSNRSNNSIVYASINHKK